MSPIIYGFTICASRTANSTVQYKKEKNEKIKLMKGKVILPTASVRVRQETDPKIRPQVRSERVNKERQNNVWDTTKQFLKRHSPCRSGMGSKQWCISLWPGRRQCTHFLKIYSINGGVLASKERKKERKNIYFSTAAY
jgi:hypothetical protein